MSIVEIKPGDMKQFTVLEGGQYGSGLQHEADVELTKFQFPATEKNLPGYDKEGKEGPHAYFLVRTVLPNGKDALSRCHIDNMDKLKLALAAIGVEVADTPDGGIAFDGDDVAPRKLGGVEVKDAREGKDGVMYNGDVIRFLGA